MVRASFVIFLLAVSSSASAQETGVASELERLAQTTPDEKKAYALESVDEITDEVRVVDRMLEAARRSGNADQIQCLNNRLVAMRALLQVSSGAETAMKAALGNAEGEKADHEFRKIAVAREKGQQLRAEADACVDSGQAGEIGRTTTTVNGGAGDSSDLVNPYVDLVFTFDPPEASPFM